MKTILAIGLAVFSVLAVISVAAGAQTMDRFYQGEVVAVDSASGSFSVMSMEQPSYVSPSDATAGLMFRTDNSTTVSMCNMRQDIHAIKVGQQVDLTYRYDEKTGNYIAGSINVRTPLVACNIK